MEEEPKTQPQVQYWEDTVTSEQRLAVEEFTANAAGLPVGQIMQAMSAAKYPYAEVAKRSLEKGDETFKRVVSAWEAVLATDAIKQVVGFDNSTEKEIEIQLAEAPIEVQRVDDILGRLHSESASQAAKDAGWAHLMERRFAIFASRLTAENSSDN